MTLLAMDSFEHGIVTFGGTGAVLSTAQARTGSRSASTPTWFTNLTLPTITTAASESVIVGFAMYRGVLGTEELFSMRRGALGEYLRLNVTSAGSLGFGVDNAATGALVTTFGTTGNVLTAGAWHYIEMEWLSDNTTGIGRLWVDGNLLIDFSGDTQVAAGSDVAYDIFFNTNINGSTFYLDDYYALDTAGAAPFNAALGAVRIEMLSPDGSVESDFVGSDADSTDNHLLIDDLPMDVTDYIESATTADRALHGISDQTLTGTPLAIRTLVYGVDADGGSQAIDILTKSDLTERATTTAMPISAGLLSDLIVLDPDGDVAWTEAQVNALEVGVEVG